MKDIRQKLYPAIIAMLMVALGAALLSRWQVSIETESPQVSPVVSPTPSVEPSRSPSPTPAVRSPAALRPPTPSPTASASVSGNSSTGNLRTGSLRVSNQTTHPVRVALLPSINTAFQEPVHWDFAPDEGSDRGLRLSLPDGELQVHEGDILVAFAEDGSRRYWGPYVIGKTNLPVWDKAQEWQLILQPE